MCRELYKGYIGYFIVILGDSIVIEDNKQLQDDFKEERNEFNANTLIAFALTSYAHYNLPVIYSSIYLLTLRISSFEGSAFIIFSIKPLSFI